MESYVNKRHHIFEKSSHFNYGNNSEYFIFICDHCHGEKRVRKEPHVTTAVREWSDNKIEGCDDNYISYIQRCPHCGKYYFISFDEAKAGFGENAEDGYMNIDELATICSNVNFMESIAPGLKATLLMQYVHTYNDTYRRDIQEREEKAPYRQSKLFTDAILFLTERCRIPKLVIADLYRQAGMFRKSLEYSADINIGIKNEELEILDKTRYLAIKGDTAPFITRSSL